MPHLMDTLGESKYEPVLSYGSGPIESIVTMCTLHIVTIFKWFNFVVLVHKYHPTFYFLVTSEPYSMHCAVHIIVCTVHIGKL